MARKPSTINPNETKAERFKRIGTPRINNALNSIRKLGNLSASQYDYTPEQAQVIINHIRVATTVLETMLHKRFQVKGPRVTL